MRTIVATLLVAASAAAAEPRVERDIAYAEPSRERQTLDVNAPDRGEGHPIVVWIHGGGWQVVDKGRLDAKPWAFTDRGFVSVSTNYRLLPDATIGEMAGDVAKAIRWARDHAREYVGDPSRVFVMGHSAGTQLAALVCTDHRSLEAEGVSPSILKGCVPVDGDTDEVPMQVATVEDRRAGIYRQKFGEEASQKRLSSVTHVAGDSETRAQSRRLVAALEAAGVPARAFAAEGKDHGSINADLGTPDDGPTRAIFEFLDEALGRPASP